MDSDAVSVHSTLSAVAWPFDRTFLSFLSYYLLSAFLGAAHLLTSAVLGAALLLPMPHSRYNPVTAVIIGSIGGAIGAPLALYVLGPQLSVLVSSRVRRSVPRRWAAVVGPGLCLALFGAPVGHTLAAWAEFVPIDCDSSARKYWHTQDGCMSGVHSVIAALLGAAVLGVVMGTIVELSCRFGKEGLWEAVQEGWEGAAGVEWRRRIAERRRLEQGDPRTGERQPLLNGDREPRYSGQYDEERSVGSPEASLISSPPPARPSLLRGDSMRSLDGDASTHDPRSEGYLHLTRPLVAFDLETTGLSTATSRIVEISLIKLHPAASPSQPPRIERYHSLVKPDVPVPRQASAIHGHTTESLALESSFATIAPQILSFLQGCDLTGYNIIKYDVPLLASEFARLDPSVPWPPPDTVLVDTMVIFHSLVPKRDLAAAHRVYTGEELQGHHGAEADAEAALRILQAMLSRHAPPFVSSLPAPPSAPPFGPPPPSSGRKGILLNSQPSPDMGGKGARDRSWSGSCDMSLGSGTTRSRSSSRASELDAAEVGLGMPRTVEGIVAWIENRQSAATGATTAQAVSAALRRDTTSSTTASQDQLQPAASGSRSRSASAAAAMDAGKGKGPALPNGVLRADAPAFTTPPKFKRPAPSPTASQLPSSSTSSLPTASSPPVALDGATRFNTNHPRLSSSASSSSTIVPLARSRSAQQPQTNGVERTGLMNTPRTGRTALDFGKYKGVALEDVVRDGRAADGKESGGSEGRRYLRWVVDGSHAPVTAKEACRNLLHSSTP